MTSERDRDPASPAEAAAPPPAPLTDAPQRELRLLVDGIREWLASLAHETRSAGFLGLLEGDVGQGQAEIIAALREACQGLGIQALWARAARSVPFAPGAAGDLAAQCLEAFHATDGDAPAAVRLSPDIGTELARIVPGAKTAPSESLPSIGVELDRLRLVDALGRGLIELSAKNPILVILEDVDSADAFTLEALHHLLRLLFLRRTQGRAPRVLVIATVAPGIDLASRAGFHDLPLREIEAFRVRARGLSREDLRDWTVKILGAEGPLSFRERIFRLTTGNARHLRWLLWHARENGGLQGDVPRLPDSELTFERLVERRFDGLGDEEKRWAGFFSAIGTHCRVDVAERFVAGDSVGADAPARPAPIDALVASGWLARGPHGSRDGSAPTEKRENAARAECAISDADVAAIVLDSMPESERKRMHVWLAGELRRISSATPAAGGESKPDAGTHGDRSWLPHAFRQAQRGGDWATCAELGLEATHYLEGLGCHDEALGLLEELLEGAPRDATIAHAVELRKADLLSLTHNYREAVEAYRKVLDATQDQDARGRLLRLIGDLHGKLSERALQVKSYDLGLAETQGGQASLERLKLLAAFARTHLEAQELDRTLSYLDECIEVAAARQLAADADYPEIYRLAEEVHFHRGDYVEAEEFERCLLKGCEDRGNLSGQLQSLQHLAHLHALRGEFEASEAYLLEATRLAVSSGSRLLLARVLSALGQFKREQKDTSAALKHFIRANTIFLDFGKTEAAHRTAASILALEFERGLFAAASETARAYTSGWIALHGQAHHAEPKRADAQECVSRRTTMRQLEKRVSQTGGAASPAELLHLGALLEEEGRLQDAQKTCRECLQKAASADFETFAHAAFSLGRIAVLRGDYDGALKQFEQGLDMRGAHPRRETLAEAYLEVSLVFLARGDLARSFEYGARGSRLALEDGGAQGVLLSLQFMTAFLTETGAFAVAIALGESFHSMARAAGLSRWELAACRQLAGALARSKEHTVPPGLTAKWVELSGSLDIPVETCRMKLELGWDCCQRKDYTEALRLAREGIEIARAAGLETLIDEHLYLVGVVESASKNPRKNFLRALESLEQALQGADERKRLRLRWEVLQAMAAVYRERQKDDLAEEYQKRADELELLAHSGLPKALSAARWCGRAPASVPVTP